ncbi:FYN-binding protein 1 isoform X2 [Cynoglossus semilaevis]|uniref:FYN-binding protein 1 isoform X2 n=1 Tax=Cynoglossus semilaevis TaxID=244447 RepID=UPI000D631133|nr:FYN-binding protein 1-like isoform X2 [Cynoglossus semilaevis]
MEEIQDFRALRARFNNKVLTPATSSSQESSSPVSPLKPAFGKGIFPVMENNLPHQRMFPISPSTSSTGQNRQTPFLGAEPVASSSSSYSSSIAPRTHSLPRAMSYSGFKATNHSPDFSRVTQTSKQNMMPRNQRPAALKPALTPPLGSARSPAVTPTSTPVPHRQQQRQRSTGEVTPLRRALPPEKPLPLKPKRPPNVNLEAFKKITHRPGPSANNRCDTGSLSAPERKASLPAVSSFPKLSKTPNRLSRLPHQIAAINIDDDQEMYDDIGSFERNDSWNDRDSQGVGRDDNDDDDDDDDDLYESVDVDEKESNQVSVEKMSKKEVKKYQQQERKEKMEQQKREKELRKNFMLQGEIEVLHTAKVRHDWHGGGKLDLDVRQGESVEILRVNNNPGGKWLARSLSGNYGYISNTCVDIDCEAVKRKVLQSKQTDVSDLPPPPPDPPQIARMDFNNSDNMSDNDDDYDDVQPVNEDFPPPPPEFSVDPKIEKAFRKKFKYDGPIRVLQRLMVDPKGVIKKSGGKDLPVCQGEVLDAIQFTNSKKVLCRNRWICIQIPSASHGRRNI